MGIRLISTSTSYITNNVNPNPLVFEIQQTNRYQNYVILKVKYPGCVNYEGNKILVFEHLSDDELRGLTALDPHFSVNSKLIARFCPTDKGWAMAVNFVKMLCDY